MQKMPRQKKFLPRICCSLYRGAFRRVLLQYFQLIVGRGIDALLKSIFTVLQDGRSSGLTAPNGPSQSALIRTALASGSVDPMCVHTVSVHGTGTPLGDPIEVGALGQGLAGALARPFTMLSNKSCFGHTEGAAGVTDGAVRLRIEHTSHPLPHCLHQLSSIVPHTLC